MHGQAGRDAELIGETFLNIRVYIFQRRLQEKLPSPVAPFDLRQALENRLTLLLVRMACATSIRVWARLTHRSKGTSDWSAAPLLATSQPAIKATTSGVGLTRLVPYRRAAGVPRVTTLQAVECIVITRWGRTHATVALDRCGVLPGGELWEQPWAAPVTRWL